MKTHTKVEEDPAPLLVFRRSVMAALLPLLLSCQQQDGSEPSIANLQREAKSQGGESFPVTISSQDPAGAWLRLPGEQGSGMQGDGLLGGAQKCRLPNGQSLLLTGSSLQALSQDRLSALLSFQWGKSEGTTSTDKTLEASSGAGGKETREESSQAQDLPCPQTQTTGWIRLSDVDADGQKRILGLTTLNSYTLAVSKELLARDKGLGYSMTDPKGQHTRSLVWSGVAVFPVGNRRSHCSGATFQIFVMAVNLAKEAIATESYVPGMPKTISLPHPRAMMWQPIKSCWYIGADRPAGCNGSASALAKHGMGQVVRDFSQAQPGDFMDYDRRDGSGHSVVFLSYYTANGQKVSEYAENVVGFEFFSSNQPDKGLATAIAICHSAQSAAHERRGFDNGVYCDQKRMRIGRAHHPRFFNVSRQLALLDDRSLALTATPEADPSPGFRQRDRWLDPGEGQ